MVNFVAPLALSKSTVPKEFCSCPTNCIVLERFVRSGMRDRSGELDERIPASLGLSLYVSHHQTSLRGALIISPCLLYCCTYKNYS